MMRLILTVFVCLSSAAPLNPRVDKEATEGALVAGDVSVDIVDGGNSDGLHSHIDRVARHVIHGGPVTFSGTITGDHSQMTNTIASIVSSPSSKPQHELSSEGEGDPEYCKAVDCSQMGSEEFCPIKCAQRQPEFCKVVDCALPDSQEFCPFKCAPAVVGDWSLWSSWGTCSKHCGAGQRERTRMCSNPAGGGKTCEGVSKETEDCGNDCGMSQEEINLNERITDIYEKLNAIKVVKEALEYIEDGLKTLNIISPYYEQASNENVLLGDVDEIANLIKKCENGDSCDSNEIEDIAQKTKSTFYQMEAHGTVSSQFQESFVEKKENLNTAISAAKKNQEEDKAKLSEELALAMEKDVRPAIDHLRNKIFELTLLKQIVVKDYNENNIENPDQILNTVDEATEYLEDEMVNECFKNKEQCTSKLRRLSNDLSSAHDKIKATGKVNSGFLETLDKRLSNLRWAVAKVMDMFTPIKFTVCENGEGCSCGERTCTENQFCVEEEYCLDGCTKDGDGNRKDPNSDCFCKNNNRKKGSPCPGLTDKNEIEYTCNEEGDCVDSQGPFLGILAVILIGG